MFKNIVQKGKKKCVQVVFASNGGHCARW